MLGLVAAMGLPGLVAPVWGGDAPAPWTNPEPAAIRPHAAEPESLSGSTRALFVDFGRWNSAAPGAIGVDDGHRIPTAAWSGGMIRFVLREHPRDRLLSDFAEGEDAVLMLGAVPGNRYRLVLTLGDPETARGPVTVWVDGRIRAEDVRSELGQAVDVVCTAQALTDRIRVRFQAKDCGAFAVNGVAVYTPEAEAGGGLPDLAGAPETAGGASPVSGNAGVLARRALRVYAEYLMAHEPAEGCFSYRGNWYESSYPIRILLLAGTLLREPRYRSAAFECLDRFVAEQGADGTWSAMYFGRAECDLAALSRKSTWARNLADVGSMALCLPLATGRADRVRREAYLGAATRFADEVVLPSQLPSGAFPNLIYQGTEYRHPYSVATGIQAASLTALYAATGQRNYLEAAERAARVLVADLGSEEGIRFRPHDSEVPREAEPDELGNLMYVLEGLFWVEHYGSVPMRLEIRSALNRYFEHPQGIRSWPEGGEWLGAGDSWENSKRAGLLFLLAQYGTVPEGNTAFHRRWREDLLRTLETPARAERCGVLADPDGLGGRYAMTATGFAGMGMASLVRSGSLFPVARPRARDRGWVSTAPGVPRPGDR